MPGGEQGCLDVVGANKRDAPTWDAVDTDCRNGPAQQLPDPAVPLHLRGRRQDSVHAALQQHPEIAFGVGSLPVDAADQDAVALTAGLALRTDHKTRELGVAQVAGYDAYRAGAPGHEAPGKGVRDVSQVLRSSEDALPRLRGDRSLAVEHLADGLEAYPGLRGDVSQGYVRQRISPLPIRSDDSRFSRGGLALQAGVSDALDDLALEEQEDDDQGQPAEDG